MKQLRGILCKQMAGILVAAAMLLSGCASVQSGEEAAINGEISRKNNRKVSEVLQHTTSMGHSSEGAGITGTFSEEGEIEYLCVEILGEMGKETKEYTFAEDHIVYSYHRIYYEEPFYLADGEVKIIGVTEGRYLLQEEAVYDITDPENMIELSEKELKQMQEELQIYLEELADIS